MNTIDFCFWLQGYFEISGTKELTRDQVEMIKNHLGLVFKHEIDPLRETQTSATQATLSQAHSGDIFNPSRNDTLVRC